MTGNDVTGTGNDVTGTGSEWKNGSHVFWDGKPLTSEKKGFAGSGNRKSRVLGWETADQFEKKGSWAQDGVKPLRNAGSKSKVQLGQRGWSLTQRKTRHVKKIIYSKVSVTGDHVVIHFNCKSVPF